MNPDWEENKIKELFLELRQNEERQSPDFAEIWGAAGARLRRKRWRRWAALTGALAGLIVLGVASQIVVRGKRHTKTRVFSASSTGAGVPLVSADLPWQSAVLIYEWRSPTDFLLRSPREWPRETARPAGGSQVGFPGRRP